MASRSRANGIPARFATWSSASSTATPRSPSLTRPTTSPSRPISRSRIRRCRYGIPVSRTSISRPCSSPIRHRPVQEDRWDSRAIATVHKDEKDLKKSDVAVRITSRPITVGPSQAVVHTYRLFTGPKTEAALRPYGAEDLASYRKSGWFGIPGARLSSPLRHHADLSVHLWVDPPGVPVLSRDQGELRNRDHPAHDPGPAP